MRTVVRNPEDGLLKKKRGRCGPAKELLMYLMVNLCLV